MFDQKTLLLIVDDEMLIRWSLAERLAQEGYEVVEAADGLAARKEFAKGLNRSMVMLLDIKLPDADGVELLKEFRGQKPDCRVIMITAHGADDLAAEARREGAYAFCNKPFKIEDIVDLVNQANADAPR